MSKVLMLHSCTTNAGIVFCETVFSLLLRTCATLGLHKAGTQRGQFSNLTLVHVHPFGKTRQLDLTF